MLRIFYSRKKGGRAYNFFLLGAFCLLFLGGGWGAYSLVSELPDPSNLSSRTVAESTKIFDRTGKVLLYEVHGEEKRTIVSFDAVPERMKQATLAAEDSRFYKHGGIDVRGIIRALFYDLLRGDFSQGGSTITQQLIKNSLLGSEKTIRRKIKEQLLALLLERKYSKDKILELYLNLVPYGSNSYGVAAAAQTFFAKELPDLSLGEAAALAALPKAPTYYSPYGTHRDELLSRRNWVLDRMEDAGFVSKEDIERAKKEPLSFVPTRESLRAPHFVLYVREYLAKKYGEDLVERGGLRVITTLDWDMEQEAEKDIREGAEQNEKLVRASNAALVALDPRSGDILAMVGSRDFWGTPRPEGCTPGKDCRFDPHVNVALRPRQPGSAFKPFVYATALKKGYTPETVLFDVPTEFNPLCNADGSPGPSIRDAKDCYHPRDYDGKFRGPVSLRQALAQSLNVPSVKLLYLAGINDSIKTAESLGVTTLTDPDRYGLSLVLGGAEVTLLELTSSFGVFSQEGVLHPKTAILRVEDSTGNVLEGKKDISAVALDTEVARTINSVLSDNDARIPIFNPRSSLYFPGRSVAAKTGTTQDYRDAWVVGYTPSLVTGVWVGNSDNSPMNQSGLSVMVAGPIWHRFLDAVLSKSPPEDFIKPAPFTSPRPVLRGIYRTGEIIKIDALSKKLATPDTPPELIEEVGTGSVRSILASVNRGDPLGDPPADPDADPQYKNWQAGIDFWLAANTLPSPVVPSLSDDLHTRETRPEIVFPSLPGPINRAAFHSISVSIKSFFPLKEVSLFIDDVFAGSKTGLIIGASQAFSLPELLSSGTHKIKITAYDAVGNKTEAVSQIILE